MKQRVQFSRRARWAVPAGAVIVVGGVLAGSMISVASAAPSLPAKTPAQLADYAHLPETIENVADPKTLATAIKIGAPVSWRKSLRAILRSRGQVVRVSEQEIADAKAMIGRDGFAWHDEI